MEKRLWTLMAQKDLSSLTSLLNDFRLGIDLGLIEPISDDDIFTRIERTQAEEAYEEIRKDKLETILNEMIGMEGKDRNRIEELEREYQRLTGGEK